MKTWKRTKKQIATALIFSLILSFAAVGGTEGLAKAKPTLNKTKLTLKVGKSAKLKAKNLTKKQKKKLKWSSSNTWVATVSSSGKVKAKNVGKAKITAKTGSKKIKCTVTVKAKSTPSTSSTSNTSNTSNTSSTTPVPTENPKSNVDSVSTDQLAANVTVKMEKYQEGVLLTVTNNNTQWLDLDVNYNLKNSSGVSIETGTVYFGGMKPGASQERSLYLYDIAADVDVNKSEVSKTASYYSHLTYTDQTASVNVSSEKNTTDDVVITTKNNSNVPVSGYYIVYFKDASGNIVSADYNFIDLEANQTDIKTVYAPYVYDDDLNRLINYATYEVKYYAYSYTTA